MRLDDLATAVGALVLTHVERAGTIAIERVHVAGAVSDLLAASTPGTLLVTGIVSPKIVELTELLDVPSLCVIGTPPEGLVASARASGKVLLALALDAETLRVRLDALGIPCERGRDVRP